MYWITRTFSEIDFDIGIDLGQNLLQVTSNFLSSPFCISIFTNDVFQYKSFRMHFSILHTSEGYFLHSDPLMRLSPEMVTKYVLTAVQDQLKKLAVNIHKDEVAYWRRFGFAVPRKNATLRIYEKADIKWEGKVVKRSPTAVFLYNYADKLVWQIPVDQIQKIESISSDPI